MMYTNTQLKISLLFQYKNLDCADSEILHFKAMCYLHKICLVENPKKSEAPLHIHALLSI